MKISWNSLIYKRKWKMEKIDIKIYSNIYISINNGIQIKSCKSIS